MRTHAFVCVILLALSAGATALEGVPVGFCIAPEMQHIPELDGWEFCQADAYPEQAAKATASWRKVMPWVTARVTPELARDLSRWAKEQMKQYQRVPSLDTVTFKPVRDDERHRNLVLEGTVDTLPSHAPLVTRWLKLYLLCDLHSGEVIRVTVTIRGQILE
jgi:hypothetical protein